VDGYWLPTRGRDGSLEALRSVSLTRPHQARQPGHVVWFVHVKRVEVDPGPPGDLEGLLGSGTGPPGRHDNVGASGSLPATRWPS